MYIFNPEHDLCLANGDIHFVPPESALTFGKECASLTNYMYGLDLLADCDNPSVQKIIPWGWNKTLRAKLLKEGFKENIIATEREISDIAALSHRTTAIKGYLELYNNCKSKGYTNGSIIAPTYRIAAHSLSEIEDFLQRHHHIVLKAPLSGSGKGIRFVTDTLSHSDKGWCRNLLQKFNYVVVEKRFTPIIEFAMLFNSDSVRGISFLGYSLFLTHNGAYRGNLLASNNYIREKISQYINWECIELCKIEIERFLAEQTRGKYEGFIGVDQFLCTDYPSNWLPIEKKSGNILYNPVVEINFRMTMGILARNIYDNFAQKENLEDGKQIFEILRRKSGNNVEYLYEIVDKPIELTHL